LLSPYGLDISCEYVSEASCSCYVFSYLIIFHGTLRTNKHSRPSVLPHTA